MVRTIALKDDALAALLPVVRTLPLRTMLRWVGTPNGGEDVPEIPPVWDLGAASREAAIASRCYPSV